MGALVGLVGSAGCVGQKPAEQAPVEAGAPERDRSTFRGATSDQVKLRLLDRGAEPRAPITFRPPAGDPVTLRAAVGRMLGQQGVDELDRLEVGQLSLQVVRSEPEGASVTLDGGRYLFLSHGGLALARLDEHDPALIATTSPTHDTLLISGLSDLPAGFDTANFVDRTHYLDALFPIVPFEAVGVGARWSFELPRRAYEQEAQETTEVQLLHVEEEGAVWLLSRSAAKWRSGVRSSAVGLGRFPLDSMKISGRWLHSSHESKTYPGDTYWFSPDATPGGLPAFLPGLDAVFAASSDAVQAEIVRALGELHDVQALQSLLAWRTEAEAELQGLIDEALGRITARPERDERDQHDATRVAELERQAPDPQGPLSFTAREQEGDQSDADADEEDEGNVEDE